MRRAIAAASGHRSHRTRAAERPRDTEGGTHARTTLSRRGAWPSAPCSSRPLRRRRPPAPSNAQLGASARAQGTVTHLGPELPRGRRWSPTMYDELLARPATRRREAGRHPRRLHADLPQEHRRRAGVRRRHRRLPQRHAERRRTPSRSTTSDAAASRSPTAKPLLDKAGITLLDPSEATDTNAFFVTKKYSDAEQRHHALRPRRARAWCSPRPPTARAVSTARAG